MFKLSVGILVSVLLSVSSASAQAIHVDIRALGVCEEPEYDAEGNLIKPGDTCVMVDDTCNGCGGWGAINQLYTDYAKQLKDTECLQYEGKIQTCSGGARAPAIAPGGGCVKRRCQPTFADQPGWEPLDDSMWMPTQGKKK